MIISFIFRPHSHTNMTRMQGVLTTFLIMTHSSVHVSYMADKLLCHYLRPQLVGLGERSILPMNRLLPVDVKLKIHGKNLS